MQKILCVQSSLLEMWRFNEEAIKAATMEEVIEGVNQLERRQESPKLQLNSTSGNIVLIR